MTVARPNNELRDTARYVICDHLLAGPLERPHDNLPAGLQFMNTAPVVLRSRSSLLGSDLRTEVGEGGQEGEANTHVLPLGQNRHLGTCWRLLSVSVDRAKSTLPPRRRRSPGRPPPPRPRPALPATLRQPDRRRPRPRGPSRLRPHRRQDPPRCRPAAPSPPHPRPAVVNQAISPGISQTRPLRNGWETGSTWNSRQDSESVKVLTTMHSSIPTGRIPVLR